MTISIPVASLSQEDIVAALSSALEPFGCTVLRGEWLSPHDLRLRLNLTRAKPLGANRMSHKLASSACPPFNARRGPSGRIVVLAPTPELEAFLRA